MKAATLPSVLITLLAPMGSALDAQSPLVELDHVYVVVPDQRAAVARLVAAGLTIDTTALSTRHEGSGTASTAATFDNAYLEVLWVDPNVSVSLANRAEVDRLSRAATWSGDGPSPFGVGLRRTGAAPDSLPYRGVRETADWIEPGSFFFSFESSNEDDPAVFVVPDDMALTTWAEGLHAQRPDLFEHSLGVHRLTLVTIAAAAVPASVTEANLAAVRFRESASPGLELTFDNGRQGMILDLRPSLPLVLRW